MSIKENLHSRLLFLFAVLSLGCDSGKLSNGRQSQTSHLRLLISLYNYSVSELGHIPESQAEFEEFISQKCQETLERSGVDSAKDLLVSERSGQPLVIAYGAKPNGVSTDVVAYESVEIEGTRQVGYRTGRIQSVNETEFLELVPIAAE